jgi:hypothetical protein
VPSSGTPAATLLLGADATTFDADDVAFSKDSTPVRVIPPPTQKDLRHQRLHHREPDPRLEAARSFADWRHGSRHEARAVR